MAKNKQPLDKKEKRRRRRKRALIIIPIIIVLLIILAFAGFRLGNKFLEERTGATLEEYQEHAKEVVDSSSVESFMPNKTSYIYASDGTELISLNEETKTTYIEYDQIPETVIQAFIAVEDRTFWDNSGIDVKGMARVLLNYVRTNGEVAQGASTITQQLARTIFLTQDKTMSRKVNEIFISLELTKKYSKEQIMEFYVNNCCFANGVYGIEDAAYKYLSKSPSELTLSETAYLCAIPNRPEYYNPFTNPNNAIERRDKILDDMLECGYITEEECLQAKDEFITVKKVATTDTQNYSYETTYAIHCIEEYFMEANGFQFQYHFETLGDYNLYQEQYKEAQAQAKHMLYTGGYKIQTSLDLDKQAYLQGVVDSVLAEKDLTIGEDGVYNLQGSMTVIDNTNGKVVAMVGGRSQDELSTTMGLNRGFQSLRQPGSCIKPIAVYTPAMTSGDYDPTSVLQNIDVQAAYKNPDAIEHMSGDSMNLRMAVWKSRNGCAVQLFSAITPAYGLSFLEDMGFTGIVKETDYNLSSALGGLTKGTNTYEMANAYYTLENHGIYQKSDCIFSIKDYNGNEVYQSGDQVRVYSEVSADFMTDIMTGVITSGTAARMNWYAESDVEVCGKTGTTNGDEYGSNSRDGWFCGYSPYYTISVWVGNDDNTVVEGLQGSSYPLSIWKRSMLYLVGNKEKAEFQLCEESTLSKYRGTWETKKVEEETEEEVVEELTEAPAADTTTTTDQTNTTPSDSGNTTTTPDSSSGSSDSGSGFNGGNSGNDSGGSNSDSSSSGGDSGSGGSSGGDSGSNSGGGDSSDTGSEATPTE